MGVLLIAGLCLALGAILGYAYRPKPKLVDPLNLKNEELNKVIDRWREVTWVGPRDVGDSMWTVRHNLMEPMLDALDIGYHNDQRET